MNLASNKSLSSYPTHRSFEIIIIIKEVRHDLSVTVPAIWRSVWNATQSYYLLARLLLNVFAYISSL